MARITITTNDGEEIDSLKIDETLKGMGKTGVMFWLEQELKVALDTENRQNSDNGQEC